ncbi:MAG: hypothetical protein EZS28_041581 [Streblomastix strix]|uniref:Uncharacterized protein n=1 Tax=Streblomastix strix TaxID=222440 RepID=A0A5J4TYS6_9EUKA|nr:MAG: hypothetical protein EZS28_041581 [Streblomastix strix]
MILQGDGIDKTIIRNDINDVFNPSVLISIQPDNNQCKHNIMDISFEQDYCDSSSTYALMWIEYGQVIMQRCSFTQLDTHIVHYQPYILIREKCAIFQEVTFNSGNFSQDIVAVDVVTEGGGQFYNCNFTNIVGAAVIRADLSFFNTTLLLQDCRFQNCISQYSSSSLSGSTIVVTNTVADDYSTNRVKIILNYPICTFTRCQFTGNTGKSEVKFLGKLMYIGFVQCNIDSASISYDSLWTSTYWDEIKYFSFGGCSGSASNETIYVNSTGLDSGTGTISNPLHSITQAINQKTQGGQTLLTLQIGSGTWEDDGLMIGARSISLQGSGVNDTLLMNKITTRIWFACIIGGRLSIQNVGLRQASSSEYYGGMLILRGNGMIEITNVYFRQREQIINQSSSSIYATAGDVIITNCSFERATFINRYDTDIHSATIFCDDSFRLLQITQTNISQQFTSFVAPPTSDIIQNKQMYDYKCGAIAVLNAQQLKFEQCNFNQNQGWKVGAINIQQMNNNFVQSEIGSDPTTPQLSIKQ